MTKRRKPGTRTAQIVQSSQQHYSTPMRSRRGIKYQAKYVPLGQQQRLELLRANMDVDSDSDDSSSDNNDNNDIDISMSFNTDILDNTLNPITQANSHPSAISPPSPPHNIDTSTCPDPDVGSAIFHHHIAESKGKGKGKGKSRAPRSLLPSVAAEELYGRWKELVPLLAEPFLQYETRMAGKEVLKESDIKWDSKCIHPNCSFQSAEVQLLFWDHFSTVSINYCDCTPLPITLVAEGFFPTSPTEPRVAISVDLLNLHGCLFEKSGVAVSALASSLNAFYFLRGWRMVNGKGHVIQDPFRRGLSNAIQWYENLRSHVSRKVEDHLADCKKIANERTSSNNPRCSRLLRTRCPACFGGDDCGKVGNKQVYGSQFQVCLDGNFHQRHRKSAGDSPSFYDASYFLPKSYVDDVGKRIEDLRKKPPKAKKAKGVPDDAIDSCQGSHTAGDESNIKANAEIFDDTGVMALVCKHNIPLCLANIDTPGEQQKYPIALLMWLFTHIPPWATVDFLYDLACVLFRSLVNYPILPDNILDRLTALTPAMHAYAHDFKCQLAFNTRLQTGAGLTDGESTERLWSLLRGLIPITRSSARSRRIWLIDRKMASINNELRNDLGIWIKRKLTKGVMAQRDVANKELATSGFVNKIVCLNEQWRDEKATQGKLRSHSQKRIMEDFGGVLELQSNIENIANVLETTKASLSSQMRNNRLTQEILTQLEDNHLELLKQCDELYESLNLNVDFPNLQGMTRKFVVKLLMARDLKINIRKRAVASFLEWEKLDQPVSGKHRPLGTKVHQRTRGAITKRQKPMLTAIRKFNKYCKQLHNLKADNWDIPIPRELPTDLASLRDDDQLALDVWISPLDGTAARSPPWLTDPNVRLGIKAMLKLDRCREEERRLKHEARNLLSWFGDELCALNVAIQLSAGSIYEHRLEKMRKQHLLYKSRWETSFYSEDVFDQRRNAADRTAKAIVAGLSERERLRLLPTLSTAPRRRDFDHTYVEISDVSDDGSFDDTSDEEDVDDLDGLIQFKDGNGDDLGEDMLDALILDDQEDKWVDEVENTSAKVEYQWEFTTTSADCDDFVDIFSDYVTNCGGFFPNHEEITSRSCPNSVGSSYPDDLQRLHPGKLLNDVCVNDIGRSMHLHFTGWDLPPRYALVNSMMINIKPPTHRSEEEDKSYLRRIGWSHMQNCSVLIFPVHRDLERHWTLVAYFLETKEIFHFDSFAERVTWKRDLKKTWSFVKRAYKIAGEPLTGVWTARPLMMSQNPLQTNGADCGVWVLACALALMRGKRCVKMTEGDDITQFRRFLMELAISYPQV